MSASAIKRIVKRVVPKATLAEFYALRAHLKSREARLAFEQAGASPAWLDEASLQALQQQYGRPPDYGYDPHSLECRGQERASALLRFIPSLRSLLEVGCWDGMVSCALQKEGNLTTAIDLRANGFDRRATDAGAHLLQMDAAGMGFDDNRFDAAFSYEAFEHLRNPEAVLREMIRVTRPGGHIYLNFGPLFMAPTGLHASWIITVPYCQHLFSIEMLQSFPDKHQLGTIEVEQMNRWTLQQFRKLWSQFSDDLKPLWYYEYPDISALDLIVRYPILL